MKIKNKYNFDDILNELKNKINLDDITYIKIIGIIPDIVEIVEKTKISGELKKNITKLIIKQLIIETDLTDNDIKKCLNLYNDGIIDISIENIIRASKINYKVNYKSKLQKIIRNKKHSIAAIKISKKYSNSNRKNKL
tara:strand:- start:109 stop:522 length:414 start_codon:yes stop_codon:yes gene_type:complete